MTPETLAWFAFCGAVFLLMGLGLVLGARRHATAAASWMAGGGEPDEAARRRLAWSYRAAGAAFAGFGLWTLWGLAMDPARLASLYPHRSLTPASRALGGLFFMSMGALLFAQRLSEFLRPEGPSRALADALGLPSDPGPEDWAQKAGRWAAWLLALVFLAFGAYLIRRVGAKG